VIRRSEGFLVFLYLVLAILGLLATGYAVGVKSTERRHCLEKGMDYVVGKCAYRPTRADVTPGAIVQAYALFQETLK
jgi:hypothetical protein